ncbi:MAG: hypothetical protein ACI9WU_003944, partial [Myxococcota bacterium]
MSGDRRRYVREPRFLRLVFKWREQEMVGITTNVSEGGAFLNVSDCPPEGSVVELLHEAVDDIPEILFAGIVQRVIDPLSRISVVPGVGVRWLQATSTEGAEKLRVALRSLLDVDTVQVTSDENGRGVWRPIRLDLADEAGDAPNNLNRVKQDLQRIEGSRPEVPRGLGPLPRAGEDLERRGVVRAESGVEVTFYVNRAPVSGSVRNVSLRGMWVDCHGEIPATGEVLTCRYPVPSKTGIRWVRLVGVIVRRETGRKPGFGVETISVDNLGIPRLFEEHVDALSR